jgi:hypothetical protein
VQSGERAVSATCRLMHRSILRQRTIIWKMGSSSRRTLLLGKAVAQCSAVAQCFAKRQANSHVVLAALWSE